MITGDGKEMNEDAVAGMGMERLKKILIRLQRLPTFTALNQQPRRVSLGSLTAAASPED